MCIRGKTPCPTLMGWKGGNIMMQRTANENAACLRRICKRSDQPKIERLVNNSISLASLFTGNGGIWFSTERDWSQECYHGNNLEGVILFLLWCTFLVPSLKNTASIFLEIMLIECCTVLVEPSMTSSLSSFA